MPDRTRLLELALKGLQAERTKIDDEIAQIRAQLNHQPATATTATAVSAGAAPPRKRRRMSAEQKKKISETMKRRYAQINKTATKAASQVSKVESVGGSRLTAAGRKKLSDLMKKRWAERRKGMMK